MIKITIDRNKPFMLSGEGCWAANYNHWKTSWRYICNKVPMWIQIKSRKTRSIFIEIWSDKSGECFINLMKQIKIGSKNLFLYELTSAPYWESTTYTKIRVKQSSFRINNRLFSEPRSLELYKIFRYIGRK